MYLWPKNENFLSLYSCAHDGFCKRCPIAELKVSGELLLDWLKQEEYLQSCVCVHSYLCLHILCLLFFVHVFAKLAP